MRVELGNLISLDDVVRVTATNGIAQVTDGAFRHVDLVLEVDGRPARSALTFLETAVLTAEPFELELPNGSRLSATVTRLERVGDGWLEVHLVRVN